MHNPNSTLEDMQRIVRFAAEPYRPGDSIKGQIRRAATKLGLPHRRTYSMWYATPGTAVRAHEADRLRAAELQLLRERGRRLKAELDLIKARLNACGDSGASGAGGVLDNGTADPLG